MILPVMVINRMRRMPLLMILVPMLMNVGQCHPSLLSDANQDDRPRPRRHPSLLSDANQDDRPSAPVIQDLDMFEYETDYSESYDGSMMDKELTNTTLEDLEEEGEDQDYQPLNVKISYSVKPGKPHEDEGVTNSTLEGMGPVLTWWQILLIVLACLLVTASCCYLSRCCFLVADCCSDPFWGCCPCCRCCAARSKYHGGIRKVTSSAYDLNESRTVVSSSRRSGLSSDSMGPRSRTSRSASRDPVSASRDHVSASRDPVSASRDHVSASRDHVSASRDIESSISLRDPMSDVSVNDTIESQEENNITSITSVSANDNNNTSNGRINNSRGNIINTSISNSTTLGTNNNSMEKSATVTRNYKRRPTSEVAKDKSEGLNESQPHVYEGDASYFSIFHFLGRNKRRYTVSPQKRQGYRRNHHIAESRNSAVIPTKISKRSSTASTYMTRPMVNQRSKSVESFSSNEAECEDRLLEETDTNLNRSERSLPGRPHSRSRLSANLADLESRSERCLSSRNRSHGSQGRITPANCPTAPLIDKQTLKYFEKSLLGSKETTL